MKTNASIALAAGITSITQLRIIEILAEGEPATITRIADEIGRSTAAMTGALDILEHLGLIERTAVPGDRRATHVRLTDWKGKGLVADMRAAATSAHLAAITA